MLEALTLGQQSNPATKAIDIMCETNVSTVHYSVIQLLRVKPLEVDPV